MARAKKKPVKKFRFELTLGAIGGIGVVCFCIFLWMFLLGVWTGQTLLLPVSADTSVVEVEDSQDEVLYFSEQKKHKPQ